MKPGAPVVACGTIPEGVVSKATRLKCIRGGVVSKVTLVVSKGVVVSDASTVVPPKCYT